MKMQPIKQEYKDASHKHASLAQKHIQQNKERQQQ